MEPVIFRNLRLRFATKGDVLDAVAGKLPVRIATANPEFIEEASENPRFRKALEEMTHVTVDGFGLFLALSAAGYTSLGRYTGSNFLAEALRGEIPGIKRIALLGGQSGSVDTLKDLYAHSVVFAEDGGIFDRTYPTLSAELTKKLVASKPDLLAIGLGAPKQELLIQAVSHLPIHTMIGIGGSFEFLAGKKKRAPKIIQRIGLEWLWRSIWEKGHFKRLWRALILFPIHTFSWLLLRSRTRK